MKQIPPAHLIAAARRLVGTKFALQGHDSKLGGLDCIGTLTAVATAAGMGSVEWVKGLYEATGYNLTPTPAALEYCRRYGKMIPAPIPGCVMLFRIKGAKHPYHVAIYTELNTMIHAENYRTQTVVENAYGAPWSRWLHSCWAMPDVLYPELVK